MKRTSCGSSAVRTAARSPLRSSTGPAGDVEAHPELRRHDAGQRRLAEPGRPGEQHVVEGLAALAGGLQEDRQLLLHALLADEVVQPARAQRAVELVLRADVRRRSRGASVGPSLRASARRGRAARGPRRRGRRARRPGPRRPPRAGSRARRGRRGRTGGCRRRPRRRRRAAPLSEPSRSRSSSTIRSAVRLPTPLAACRRALSPRAMARRSSSGPATRADRERQPRPDPVDRGERLEEGALLRRREPVEVERLLAHHQDGEQRRLRRPRRGAPGPLWRRRGRACRRPRPRPRGPRARARGRVP